VAADFGGFDVDDTPILSQPPPNSCFLFPSSQATSIAHEQATPDLTRHMSSSTMHLFRLLAVYSTNEKLVYIEMPNWNRRRTALSPEQKNPFSTTI
jgi:hypothetical protein